MVVTMWTIFIALIVFRHILPKNFLAFLACKRHLYRLGKLVVFSLGMALSTVKPLLAAGSPDGDLRVQDMFTE